MIFSKSMVSPESLRRRRVVAPAQAPHRPRHPAEHLTGSPIPSSPGSEQSDVDVFEDLTAGAPCSREIWAIAPQQQRSGGCAAVPGRPAAPARASTADSAHASCTPLTHGCRATLTRCRPVLCAPCVAGAYPACEAIRSARYLSDAPCESLMVCEPVSRCARCCARSALARDASAQRASWRADAARATPRACSSFSEHSQETLTAVHAWNPPQVRQRLLLPGAAATARREPSADSRARWVQQCVCGLAVHVPSRCQSCSRAAAYVADG